MLQLRVAASSPEVLSDPAFRGARNQDKGHVAALTGYRGIAALVVLVVHGAGHTLYPHIGLRGYGPVALFVLSGYLLTSPWSKWSLGRGPRPDVIDFVKRRVARIFPAYLVCLVVVALIYPASRPKDGMSWLRAATLTSWLRPDGLRPGMEHLWSMGTEFSWYFALPLIGLALGRLGRGAWRDRPALLMLLVLLGAAAITAAWLIWVDIGDIGLTARLTYPLWLPAYLVCFIAGATVRHLQLMAPAARGGGAIPGLARLWWVPLVVAAGAAAVLVSPWSGPPGYVMLSFPERTTRFVAATVLALSLLVATVSSPPATPVRRLFERRGIVALGRWSYGIYLWHLPVTILLAENMAVPPGPAGSALWILLLTAISAVLGALTHKFIEKPSIAWSKRSTARGAMAPGAPPSPPDHNPGGRTSDRGRQH